MGDNSENSSDTPRSGGLGSRVSEAAHPVGGTTIHTDADGLKTGEITALSEGFDVPVYYARPSSGNGPFPVLLVVSEVFGVHAHIADVCRRFAKLGYLALAPDLFARRGNASSFESLADLIRDVISQTPDSQVITDLDAVQALPGELGGDTGRLGITGFCWGGRLTWLYTAHALNLKAAVAWYGRLDGDVSSNTPLHPVSVTGLLRAPVLGLYAGYDSVVPINHVSSMRAVLEQGNDNARNSRIDIYPDAGHAFFADYRESYRADDACDGWQKCLSWFAEHGVA
jgi:carboxymethylenebutenolidase